MAQRLEVYALVGARLIDGTGRAPVAEATVLVDGREIVAVGPAKAISIPDGVPCRDLGGLTLMPGMIDGHVHLRSNAGERRHDVHLWNVLTFFEEQAIHAAGNAVTALRAGFTTVRDMAGGRLEVSVRHAMDDFVLPGARVVASGFVGMTAGHGDMFVPPVVEQRMWPPVDGPNAARRLVREYGRDGVDFIKICTSGGVLSIGDRSEWRNFTDEETRAIVDEAHALGKRVAAHAHSSSGIRQALEAGVDTLEHGSLLDDELIEMLVRQGTWLCPTMAISEYIVSVGAARGVPPASLAKARDMHDAHIESMRQAYRAGVRMFMGTDSCNTMAFGRHAWELELMQRQIGMTPMEVIVASTSSAAAALDLGDVTGVVLPGRRADFVVVDGDPLADLALLQDAARIPGVFRDGRLLVDRGLPPFSGAH